MLNPNALAWHREVLHSHSNFLFLARSSNITSIKLNFLQIPEHPMPLYISVSLQMPFLMPATTLPFLSIFET